MIEIKNSEGIVLYASETASDLRAAVVEAVGKKADLGGANLGGADLDGARCGSVLAEKCDRILTASSGSGYQMVFVRHPDGISVHAGCRDFESIAKAREHWREGKGHDPKHLADCLSALDYLTALAKQRGWTLPEEDIEAAA